MSAIYVGGLLQLLFGVRGARWDKRKEIVDAMNEHWSRPLSHEVPAGIGCCSMAMVRIGGLPRFFCFSAHHSALRHHNCFADGRAVAVDTVAAPISTTSMLAAAARVSR